MAVRVSLCFSVILALLHLLPGATEAAEEMPRVAVADDSSGFVLLDGKEAVQRTPFVPWGFNYDHDRAGRLIEDYWHDEWAAVEEDFGEMRGLGANVVRVHLQFGRFMTGPTSSNDRELKQLSKLLELAEKTGLYLNITGLGCYHKADVPEWYAEMTEEARWDAQAEFWRAIAKTCAASPAVFCYDLMNEPVAPGGKRVDRDWLGPAFGDKHFVQFITLDQKDRPRPEIAKEWIRRLAAAVRKEDPKRLVTVGLVDWSLDRPGLTSGFVPDRIHHDLDFLSVHIYPEAGKIDAAIETLAGFAAVGKPVVIEETFPLKCSIAEFEDFVSRSRRYARGWTSFYWGKTRDELRESGALPDAILLQFLDSFERLKPSVQ